MGEENSKKRTMKHLTDGNSKSLKKTIQTE